ncbi:hypothetical protein HDU98_008964 [Podochytrium sp. JEL0797]|nr:hypothetical protein HDU98_008964 [Podochytrium sp. JEL0797]
MEALSLFVVRRALQHFVTFAADSQDVSGEGFVLGQGVAHAEHCSEALANAGLPFLAVQKASFEALRVRKTRVSLAGLVADLEVRAPRHLPQPNAPLAASAHFAASFLRQQDSDSDSADDSPDPHSPYGPTAMATAIHSLVNSVELEIKNATLRIHIEDCLLVLRIASIEFKLADPKDVHGDAKQVSFEGISVKIVHPSDSNPESPFESSLFAFKDESIENRITISVDHSWDIQIAVESPIYSIMNLETLACINRMMASFKHLSQSPPLEQDASSHLFESSTSSSEGCFNS